MPVIPLAKSYQEAAEGMLRLVRNGTRLEGREGEVNYIEVCSPSTARRGVERGRT